MWPIILAVILVGGLATYFIIVNTKKEKTYYPFEECLDELSQPEIQFYLLLSNYRSTTLGTNLLKVDKLACDIAKQHSSYMLGQGYASHDYLEMRSVYAQYKGAYSYGEIAGNHVDIIGVFEKFKKSPTHNAAMLNKNYGFCGISIKKTDRDEFFCTVTFINPRLK